MSSRNEVDLTLGKWLPNDTNQVSYLGSDMDILHLRDFFDMHDGASFDRPDAFLRLKNEVLIIEHFQFDCYKQTASGSSFAKLDSELSKSFDSLHEHNGYLHCEIKASNSLEYYYVNACNSFQKHYEKIESYKRNLINKGFANSNDTFIVCFIIDDTTKLGTMVEGTNGAEPVILVLYRRFLEFLQQYPCVDYILTSAWFLNSYYPWFYSQANHASYVNKQIDYDQMQFMVHDTQVLFTSAEVDPKSIIGEDAANSQLVYAERIEE